MSAEAPVLPATRREARAVPAPRRPRARAVGDAVLTLASVAGVACIALVILAAVFDVTLIMFRTGSMSPTIPTGSVAVVQRVPASELAVGDVVTIDRAGQLPVTHRITGLAPGSRPEERTVTMRGDANAQDDPFPYVVESGRRVILSVPGGAPVIVQLSQPWALGALTLCATALVGWAFWPTGGSGRSRRRARRSRG